MLRTALYTLIVVAAIPFIGLAFEKMGGEGEMSDRDFEVKARVMCASRIEDSLRNPSSVEWDGRATWPIIEDGEGMYTVIAKYRAENGFGGMVKETRQCLVVRREDKAAVLAVE